MVVWAARLGLLSSRNYSRVAPLTDRPITKENITMRNCRTPAALAFAVAAAVAGASALFAGPDRKKPVKPEDVTLIGKIVDLQTFMTGKYTNPVPVRTTQECIRQGVPAALETEKGLIVIGMGERGPSRALIPLANKRVEVKGTLYEKDGLQYIDMVSATLVKEKEEAEEGEDAEEHDGEEAPIAEPEP